MEKENIIKIVLTGGPCAGKTTILEEIEKYLKEKKYYVITLGETATEVMNYDIRPSSDKDTTLIFQDIILKQQFIKEQSAYAYAKQKCKYYEKVIILCDRGIMDNFAYLDGIEEFESILTNNNLDYLSILYSYDLTIDLISTATLKPDSYELDEVRYEPLEQASQRDRKTSTSWSNHPNLKVIKPTIDINKKKDIVLKEIDSFLTKYENPYKELYELDMSSDLSIYNDDNSRLINITKIYLDNNIVITEEKYRNSIIYLLKKNNYEKIISKEELYDLIIKNNIIAKENFKEITFIDKGNFYKIIEKNNKLYLEFDKLNEIPNNLILSSKKKYVKTKKI